MPTVTWYRANREKALSYAKIYAQVNRAKINEKLRQRRSDDLIYRDRINAQKRASSARNKATGKAWRLRNRDKVRAMKRADYQRHKAKYLSRARAWAIANAEKVRSIKRASYLQNREQYYTRQIARRRTNPQKERAWRKRWLAANPAKKHHYVEKARAWQRAHPEWVREYHKKRARKLRTTQPELLRARNRAFYKKQWQNLGNTYVKSTITRGHFSARIIPPALVEAKRKYLQLN